MGKAALDLMREVFEPCKRKWRGIGEIPASGLRFREAYAALDAQRRFEVTGVTAEESKDCHAGEVLQGRIKPNQCPAFGTLCAPERPLGAPMVSSEGACEVFGLDPLYMACEGRFIAFVPAGAATASLEVLKKATGGRGALIGHVSAGPAGQVRLKTSIGVDRVLEMLAGEQLPRIC